MTADTWRDQIAAAIAVHWFTVNSETLADPGSRRAWISCRCGWFGENLDPDTVPEREREKGRHVADAVMPILAAAVAEARAEALRDAAAAMTREKGLTFADALMVRWLNDRAADLARNVGSQP